MQESEDFCPKVQPGDSETVQTSRFHTCSVALNEQHTRTKASSETIVGPSLFHTSPQTSGHVLYRPVSGPIVGGTKGIRRLTVRKSLSITPHWQGDNEEELGAPTVKKRLSALHGRGGRWVKGSSYVPAGHQSSQRGQGTKRVVVTVCRLQRPLHCCHDDDIVGKKPRRQTHEKFYFLLLLLPDKCEAAVWVLTMKLMSETLYNKGHN